MTTFAYFDPAKPRHTAGGFRNNYPHPEKRGFWKWKWDQWPNGLPRRPQGGYRFETAKAELSTNPSVTWVGHATVLVRVGGLNVLTDPHFSERASPLTFAGPKRVVPAVPALHELPHIDWWDSRTFKGLEVHFVPVQHWSKRTLNDENQTLWGGWVLRHPQLSFFFAGDPAAIRRTSPTSARASAASTSRRSRSARTSRAGS